MNSDFKAKSIEKLETDLKRVLRVQFKEFIHHIDESLDPRNPARGARILVTRSDAEPVCSRLAA